MIVQHPCTGFLFSQLVEFLSIPWACQLRTSTDHSCFFKLAFDCAELAYLMVSQLCYVLGPKQAAMR